MKEYVSVSQLVGAGYGARSTIMQHIAEGGFDCMNPGGGKWLINLDSYTEWLRDRSKERKRYANWKGRR